MNLENLKWTKSISSQDEEPYAYQAFKVGDIFKLAWRKDEGNANKPQREDLILLRQKGYVTHLVEVLDYKAEREKWEDEFNIYRIVQVRWVIDWQNMESFPKAEEVFDFSLKGLASGHVMLLEGMPIFQNRWQNQGDLPAFQDHVRTMLNLPSDNG